MENTELKKVGVVMPAHNSGETIRKALSSIMEQSYPDFEVFVIDDHSDDNTINIVEELQKKDNRIHLVKLEEDTGAAAARNLAIKLIEEEPSFRYVAFLDSDDYWRKDKLKTQIEYMNKEKLAFSYGDYDIYNIKSGRVNKCRICPNKMSYFRMLLGCSVGCLTVAYDKNIVGHVSIPNLPKRNDYALWCVILKKVKRGGKYPGTLAVYSRNSDGISSGNKAYLVKYHYRMHRKANHFGPLKAIFFTITNIANYVNNIVVNERRKNKRKINNVSE